MREPFSWRPAGPPLRRSFRFRAAPTDRPASARDGACPACDGSAWRWPNSWRVAACITTQVSRRRQKEDERDEWYQFAGVDVDKLRQVLRSGGRILFVAATRRRQHALRCGGGRRRGSAGGRHQRVGGCREEREESVLRRSGDVHFAVDTDVCRSRNAHHITSYNRLRHITALAEPGTGTDIPGCTDTDDCCGVRVRRWRSCRWRCHPFKKFTGSVLFCW